MKRILFLIALSLFSALPGATGGTQEAERVSIGYISLRYAETLEELKVAGAFEEYGLSVDLISYSSRATLAEAVQNGAVQAGIIDVVHAVRMIQNQQAAVRMVAVLDEQYAMYSTELSDTTLVAVDEKGISGLLLESMSSRAGIPAGGFSSEHEPDPLLRISLLHSGIVNAIVIPESFGSIAVQHGARVLVEGQLNGPTEALVVNEDVLLQHAELLGRFIRMYNRSADSPMYIPNREHVSSIGFWMLEQGMLDGILLYENIMGMLPQRYHREFRFENWQ